MTIWFMCISPPCKRCDQSNGNLVGRQKREDYLLKKMDPARTRPLPACLLSPTTNLHSGAFNSMRLHKHRRLPPQEDKGSASAVSLPATSAPNLSSSPVIWWNKGEQNVPVSTRYSFSGQFFKRTDEAQLLRPIKEKAPSPSPWLPSLRLSSPSKTHEMQSKSAVSLLLHSLPDFLLPGRPTRRIPIKKVCLSVCPPRTKRTGTGTAAPMQWVKRASEREARVHLYGRLRSTNMEGRKGRGQRRKGRVGGAVQYPSSLRCASEAPSYDCQWTDGRTVPSVRRAQFIDEPCDTDATMSFCPNAVRARVRVCVYHGLSFNHIKNTSPPCETALTATRIRAILIHGTIVIICKNNNGLNIQTKLHPRH